MMTPARIVRLIGIAGLVGWLGMVGWVAKTTRAQAQQQVPSPAPPAPSPAPKAAELPRVDPSNPPPPPIAPSEAPASPAAAPEPRNPEKAAALPAAPLTEPTPPIAPEEPPARPQPPDDLPAPAAKPATPREEAVAMSPAAEDPEKAAVAFVERNQKEAEEHLKVLTAEATQLHGRLAKVEAAIKQWQNLASALKSARKQAVASTVPNDDPGSDLEPIGDNGRGDRRRWSSKAPTAGTEPLPLAADEAEPAPTAAPAQGAVRVLQPPTAAQRVR